MKPATSPASPVTSKTDWDNLPLGEDRSYLCGGRNKFGLTKAEQYMFDHGDAGDFYPQGTPTASDIRQMALE
jgi:hypothetical protein